MPDTVACSGGQSFTDTGTFSSGSCTAFSHQVATTIVVGASAVRSLYTVGT